MSQSEVVKGFEYTFLSFLWRELNSIREAQKRGNYAQAIEYATGLVDYLPSGIKEHFRERAENIRKALRVVTTGVTAPDIFTRGIKQNRVAQRVAGTLLSSFLDELCVELDKRGYMEKGPVRPRFTKDRKLKV